MPRYIALIEVQLDEPDMEAAVQASDSLALEICHESFLVGIAKTVIILPEGSQYAISLGAVEEVDRIVCDDPTCEATAEFEGWEVRESGHTTLRRVCSGHKAALGNQPRVHLDRVV